MAHIFFTGWSVGPTMAGPTTTQTLPSINLHHHLCNNNNKRLSDETTTMLCIMCVVTARIHDRVEKMSVSQWLAFVPQHYSDYCQVTKCYKKANGDKRVINCWGHTTHMLVGGRGGKREKEREGTRERHARWRHVCCYGLSEGKMERE